MSAQARKVCEADVISRVSLARVGTADKAAAVALFLLSDDASYHCQPVLRRWWPH